MLAQAMVEKIRDLLNEGAMSQRQIARHLGVSRGSVNAIAQGKRSDTFGRPPEADAFTLWVGPPRRCPECGGMVYMPCLLCHVRALREGGQ